MITRDTWNTSDVTLKGKPGTDCRILSMSLHFLLINKYFTELQIGFGSHIPNMDLQIRLEVTFFQPPD